MTLFFIDVEATGVSPFSGVMTEFGAVHYPSFETFHGVLWESEPSKENPAIPVVTGKHYYEYAVMYEFDYWLKGFSDKPRMISDNPAFDFMWINYYFDKHLGKNPLGHSARRIGDVWAGMNNINDHSSWKKLRTTKHDHNPVNDALGNAEAWQEMMKRK